jgi:hypothetical protein
MPRGARNRAVDPVPSTDPGFVARPAIVVTTPVAVTTRRIV